MREFLFGAEYNQKKWSQEELKKLPEGFVPPEVCRIRPPGAKSLELKPLLTTGKYPRKWSEVEKSGRAKLSTPATSKNVVSQLAFFHSTKQVRMPDGSYRTINFRPILDKLRYQNVLAQTLKYVLKPPVSDEELEPVYDENGDPIYDSGIASCICDDGRIRTHIYPTKATGRWSSARPSLQNLGKQIESTIKTIFKEEYRYPLRSIFHAPPGHVFIEADYIGAEIACAAYMCNDAALLEHVRRNQLPEDDPNYYDIHSHVAVSAFRLNCEPTKKGLKSINKEYLRVIAKAVIFGLFYGRSARAIAEGAKSEGILVSEFEAQAIIDQINEMYPGLLPYFAKCEYRAEIPGWVGNAFQRFRRFPPAIDKEQQKRFGRQAKNFPIQSTVADAVSQASYYLYQYRNEWKLKSRIGLQIHDAIIMEVPLDEVKIVYEKLLPKAMVEHVPIYRADLNGRIAEGAIPQYLGIDREIFTEWGRPIHDLAQFGIVTS